MRCGCGDPPLRTLPIPGAVEWETWRRSCETDKGWNSPAQCRAVARREYERKFEQREECEENVATLLRPGAGTDTPGIDGILPRKQGR